MDSKGNLEAVVVIAQGKGGTKSPQKGEFVTLIHEIAHAGLEGADLGEGGSPYKIEPQSRPYGISAEMMFAASFRNFFK